MSKADYPFESSWQFNIIYDLFVSVFGEESTVKQLRVTRQGLDGLETTKSHWLKPKLQSRFHEPIVVPWGRLDFEKFTRFQRTVLQQLDKIPAGSTVTYGEMARIIDRPGASRAVGQALQQNPYPVLLPCHRVIRDNGTVGGYRGSKESKLKRYLLSIEGVTFMDG